MRQTTVMAISCLLLLASCGGGNPGIWELPVRLPVITSLTPPPAPLVAGQEASFTVTWQDGRDPFIVKWTFDSGAEIEEFSTGTGLREHTMTITLANAGAGTLSASGTVIVTDLGGNSTSRAFSFDVEPAP